LTFLEIMLHITTIIISCLLHGARGDTVITHINEGIGIDATASTLIRKEAQDETSPDHSVLPSKDEHKVQQEVSAGAVLHQERKTLTDWEKQSSDEEEDIALGELEAMVHKDSLVSPQASQSGGDCVMSPWKPKDVEEDCSVTCGGGECEQTRYIVTQPSGYTAIQCDPILKRDTKCNVQPCPTTTTTTAATTTMTTTAGVLRMVHFTLMPFFCLWMLV